VFNFFLSFISSAKIFGREGARYVYNAVEGAWDRIKQLERHEKRRTKASKYGKLYQKIQELEQKITQLSSQQPTQPQQSQTPAQQSAQQQPQQSAQPAAQPQQAQQPQDWRSTHPELLRSLTGQQPQQPQP